MFYRIQIQRHGQSIDQQDCEEGDGTYVCNEVQRSCDLFVVVCSEDGRDLRHRPLYVGTYSAGSHTAIVGQYYSPRVPDINVGATAQDA